MGFDGGRAHVESLGAVRAAVDALCIAPAGTVVHAHPNKATCKLARRSLMLKVVRLVRRMLMHSS